MQRGEIHGTSHDTLAYLIPLPTWDMVGPAAELSGGTVSSGYGGGTQLAGLRRAGLPGVRHVDGSLGGRYRRGGPSSLSCNLHGVTYQGWKMGQRGHLPHLPHLPHLSFKPIPDFAGRWDRVASPGPAGSHPGT